MNKILFGGSFDPIHNGHLYMALEASKMFNAEVIFIPSPIGIWKNESIDINHKINMISLAIKDYKEFSMDLFEVHTGVDYNYSIETVKYFKKLYKNDNLFYLIGGDQVNKFHLWKGAEEIANLVQLIYYPRPNIVVNQKNVDKFKMIKIDGVENDAASIDIRGLRNLNMPFSVLKYISDNNLYYIKKISSYIDQKRLLHSISTAEVCYKIAEKHPEIDKYKAYLAGLMHDIGKKMGSDIDNMKKFCPEYADAPRFAYHQFLGAYIAKEEFGIEDEEILNAIRFHTTGNDHMSKFDMVLWASDKIEPTRGYDSSTLMECMLNKPIEEGFKDVLKADKIYLETKGCRIDDALTSKCFKKYL